MAYRVLIADDEEIIRQGIEFLVDWERLDCSIVERCANGQEVIRFLEQSPSGWISSYPISEWPAPTAGHRPLCIAEPDSSPSDFSDGVCGFFLRQNRYRIFCNRFCAEKRHLRGAAPGRGESQGSSRPKAGGAEKELDAEKLSRQNRRYHLESLLRSVALGTGAPRL